MSNNRLFVKNFCSLNYKTHLVLSIVIRLIFIAYGVYHDQVSTVPYTDIDYRVYTDAARHIINNKSPYDRHTYRYTPLVAILVIPNILWHHCWGKVLFCLIDLLNAVLIRAIVKSTLHEFYAHKLNFAKNNGGRKLVDYLQVPAKSRKRGRSKQSKYFIDSLIEPDNSEYLGNISMLAWLYNFMTIAIGTRGNCDSIAVFFVLATLYFLQCQKQYFVTGLIHGISIHFRLYPIIYSLTFFMYLSNFSFYSIEDRRKLRTADTRGAKQIDSSGQCVVASDTKPLNSSNRKTIFKKEYLFYLIPNQDQMWLVFGTLLSLASVTGIFYHLYGYKFLYETYIYHLVRRDTRHNFSLYFYYQYLNAWIKNVGIWQKVLTFLPQLILILVLSIRYGLNRFSLNFSVLAQTIVIVAYNSVLTSQYFIWIMAVLPLCLWQIQLSVRNSLFLLFIWLAAQGAWLLPAYCLEFLGQNTFLFIWIQGVSFFCANIAILGRLIMNFRPPKHKEQ